MLNKYKKIVIIGSAGVGKTMLFNKLKGILKIPSIEERARVICKKFGFKNIYEIKDPKKFRLAVLEDQIKEEKKFNNFLSDRSTIDCWIHFLRWNINTAYTYETEKYFLLSKKNAFLYSHIIYIPRLYTFKSIEDGFRWNNEDYQSQIDRLFLATLKEWNLMYKTCVIQSKEFNERVKEVLEFL